MLEVLFPSGLTLFLAAAVIPLVTLKNGERLPRYISLVSTAVASILVLLFSVEILFSTQSYNLMAYQITPTFQFAFFVDRLAAFFLAVVTIVSIAVSIYSIQYVEHSTHDDRKNLIVSFMSVFIVSMILVIASASMFAFLFFWETMALASFLLVMIKHEQKETQKAGMFYFVMTHLSTLFILFSFLFIWTTTGISNIQQIAATPLITSVAFVFLFIGFGIKAGIIPFHKWLPYAHSASPSNISALMSGVMIKVGLYGIIRFVLLMPMQTWWGVLILAAGTISAVLGVIYALKEHDIKRLLAYHSIENVGIILLGVGLYVVFNLAGFEAIALLALAGGLFHTLNHAIFKSLLFMTSGSIINTMGTRNIEKMGGLIKRMPKTAILFLIGAVSISALPPFNGFVSELMIFQAFLQSVALNNPFLQLILIASLAVLALTSALAAVCFVKAFGITFLALPRSEEAKTAHESPRLMLLGSAILASLCVILGLFSVQIFGILGFSFPLPNMLFIGVILSGFYIFAYAVLRNTGIREERITETWNCGISTPNSSMEYTASGFAEPIMTVLRWILGTEKKIDRKYHEDEKIIFKEGNAKIQINKFFENSVYSPIANFVQKVSLKISEMQRGDVDFHVAYTFATIIIFLLIIWWFA